MECHSSLGGSGDEGLRDDSARFPSGHDPKCRLSGFWQRELNERRKCISTVIYRNKIQKGRFPVLVLLSLFHVLPLAQL